MKENNNEKREIFFRITLMRKDKFSYIDVDINGNGVAFVYFEGHYSEEGKFYAFKNTFFSMHKKLSILEDIILKRDIFMQKRW